MRPAAFSRVDAVVALDVAVLAAVEEAMALTTLGAQPAGVLRRFLGPGADQRRISLVQVVVDPVQLPHVMLGGVHIGRRYEQSAGEPAVRTAGIRLLLLHHQHFGTRVVRGHRRDGARIAEPDDDHVDGLVEPSFVVHGASSGDYGWSQAP